MHVERLGRLGAARHFGEGSGGSSRPNGLSFLPDLGSLAREAL